MRPRFDVYRTVSAQIRAIFAEHTNLIEPLSLDEAYLDVTENHHNISIATTIAELIRARIKAETGLNASAGISYCKFLAKTASDLNKPNGQAVARPVWGQHSSKPLLSRNSKALDLRLRRRCSVLASRRARI